MMSIQAESRRPAPPNALCAERRDLPSPTESPFSMFRPRTKSAWEEIPPIDRTSTDFYNSAQLRDALLHHPGAEKDKKDIYVDSATYCRHKVDDREFILFNLRSTGRDRAASSVLLLDPTTNYDSTDPSSQTSFHPAQCAPGFLLFNLMKPGFWKSLKDPGRFYVPNEGCLDDVLSSRGLAPYQELEKLVFQDTRSLDIESFVVLLSTISSPSSLYQKKLAQLPFWFPVVLWNVMKHFPSKIATIPSAGSPVQRLDSNNIGKLLNKFHTELDKFQSDLRRGQEASTSYFKQEERVRKAHQRQRSLLAYQNEIDAEKERADRFAQSNLELAESSRRLVEENEKLQTVLITQRRGS